MKVCSIYRPIPPISHTETLSVSNTGMAYMGGYIKNTKPSIGTYNTYEGYK
jgi:hypothetical protein